MDICEENSQLLWTLNITENQIFFHKRFAHRKQNMKYAAITALVVQHCENATNTTTILIVIIRLRFSMKQLNRFLLQRRKKNTIFSVSAAVVEVLFYFIRGISAKQRNLLVELLDEKTGLPTTLDCHGLKLNIIIATDSAGWVEVYFRPHYFRSNETPIVTWTFNLFFQVSY